MTQTISEEARAVLINFDDQGLTGPSEFATSGGTPQAVDIATSAGAVSFGGGVILTNATNLPADETSIYGTSSFAGHLQNPIIITFEHPVTNVLIDIINGLAGPTDYSVSDNQGHSSIFTVASNGDSGAQTIGLAATGTQITLASLTFASDKFDFFIDNIRFDVPITCGPDGCSPPPIPEPGTLSLVAFGLSIMFWLRRRSSTLV